MMDGHSLHLVKWTSPNLEARSAGKDLYEDNPIGLMEDVRQKLAVSVHHFPMILCPFSPRMFVLPSEGSIAEACLSNEHEDSLSPGLPPISSGSFSDGDDIPPGATLTANFLYHLAAKMDLKMEIFSLGDLSKTVGKILTDMSSLYDTLLLDRIFSSLPRRKRTTSYTHTKGSQSQVKLGPSHIQRPPIDVHIPIVNILSIEDSEREDSQVSQNVEAFLRGWDAYNQSSQVVNLVDLGNKVHIEKSLSSEIQLLSGSFVSTENFCGTPYMKALLDRRTKDGAVLIKKWLQETVRGENLTVNVRTHPGSATKSELKPMIKALAQSQSSFLRNKGIIQLAAAALGTLEESHSARWDAFISAEKMLHVSAGDTSQSLAAQIGDLINKSLVGSQGQKNGKPESSQGLLSFKDALLLMVTGSVLAGENFPTSGSGGPFSWQEEHFLKEAIVDAFLENPSAARLKFLHGLTEELEANLSRMKSEETKERLRINNDDKKDQAYDDMQLKLELRDRVDNLFRFFHKVSDLKRRNIQLREGPLGSEINFSGDSYTNKGLLYKLLTKVLGKRDVPGAGVPFFYCGATFQKWAKPSLADQNVILIFVIGGINGLEVREALEALSESGRPDMELIIGGTTLLTPDDMFDLLLGDST
ncbi:hypothetical protein Patl1_02453 [Pistacia atlantica]|uniref:Uncharacterized protein n=1 Tax=Pistacia atlantica TaxID=434234 RepID=A0ACC1CB71_9ROSI|nr:hypothetical protein Patl1_02453 [Pistacia atlantica]